MNPLVGHDKGWQKEVGTLNRTVHRVPARNIACQKGDKRLRFHRDVIDRWLASRLDRTKKKEEQESNQETQK
jgi:hypothetical protein